jgi:hypothetical protein
MPEIERRPKCDVCGVLTEAHTADCPRHAYRPGAEADPGLEARIRADARARTVEAARRRRLDAGAAPQPPDTELARRERRQTGEEQETRKLRRERLQIMAESRGPWPLQIVDILAIQWALAEIDRLDGLAAQYRADAEILAKELARTLGSLPAAPPRPDPGAKGALSGSMIEGATFGYLDATPVEVLGAVVARTEADSLARGHACLAAAKAAAERARALREDSAFTPKSDDLAQIDDIP